MPTRCYGIDLGTSTTAIGRVVDGAPLLLPVRGRVLLPSVVWVPPDGGELLVGHDALAAAEAAPERLIRAAKRALGTRHVWTFEGRVVTPVEVSTAILRHLADEIGASTGERPVDVVITVPAWFNQLQRSLTRQAGEAAGLRVRRLIAEPTAAALAHGHGKALRRTALVYDLGGGTFDVSLVRQDGLILEVQASHGDVHLGGEDVNRGLSELLVERIAQVAPARAEALRSDGPTRAAWWSQVEQAKLALCHEPTVMVPIPGAAEGEPPAVPAEREDLEEAILPVLERTLKSVDQVLADAGVSAQDVHDLVFVGGSTGLPLIWRGLFRRYGLQGDASIPVQHAVSLGAALQAAILDGTDISGILVDVAPFSLSMGILTGGIPGYPTHYTCEVITPRNCPLPSRHTHLVRTAHPTQSRVQLWVFQGSDPDPRNNLLCGKVVMEDIPPAPEDRLFRTQAITFEHDLDGLVTIRITDQLSGREVTGTVSLDGSAHEALWTELTTWFDSVELEWGDPYLAEESTVPRGGDAELDPELQAAIASFEQVLGRPADLGEQGEDLLSQARSGMLAVRAGRRADALAHHTELMDRMFEQGVYL